MPDIMKEDIKINAYDEKVEIKTSENTQRKYHKIIDLPKQADLETARSTYNNGILEVTFDKKKEQKPKGKEIKIAVVFHSFLNAVRPGPYQWLLSFLKRIDQRCKKV